MKEKGKTLALNLPKKWKRTKKIHFSIGKFSFFFGNYLGLEDKTEFSKHKKE